MNAAHDIGMSITLGRLSISLCIALAGCQISAAIKAAAKKKSGDIDGN